MTHPTRRSLVVLLRLAAAARVVVGPAVVGAAFAGGDPVFRRDRPGDVARDRPFDIEHVDLDVRVDFESRSVTGHAELRLRRLDPAATRVTLDQVELVVSAVTVDGAPSSAWHLGPGYLDVAVPPDKGEVSIGVDYTTTPRAGLYFRGPDRDLPNGDTLREVWTQGEDTDSRFWFPLRDAPDEKFTTKICIDAPADLVALAIGEPVAASGQARPGDSRTCYAQPRPIPGYTVALAIGDYRAVELDPHTSSAPDPVAVPLTAWGPAGADPEVLRRTFGVSGQQLAWLERELGVPFPYGSLRNVAVQRFLFGAMENPTLILNTDQLLVTEDADEVDSWRIVAHELAHQWFGDLVTTSTWRDLWLNEGSATFYAGLWQGDDLGPEHYARLVRGWHAGALGVAAPLAPRGYSATESIGYAAHYAKGASVLHLLREALGEETFRRGMTRFLTDHIDGNADTDDLRHALEAESGRHLGWLFDQWVHEAGAPSLEARHRWADGELVVEVTQRGDPPYHGVVTLEIGTSSAPLTRTLEVGPGESAIALPLTERPAWVAVDARGAWIARWDVHQEPAQWAAQARSSREPYARLEAVAQLAQLGGASVAPLVELLAPSQPEALRLEVAAALGTTADDEAVRALTVLAGGPPDPSVPAGAAAGELAEVVFGSLGKLGWRARGAAPLLARIAEDRRRSPRERAAALRGLADVDADSAQRVARTLLSARDADPHQHVGTAAADVLGSGDVRDVSKLLGVAREPEVRRGLRHAALRSATRLTRDLKPDDGARVDVARALEGLLDSDDLRSVQLAISQLGIVGDERSAAALDRAAKVLPDWTDLRRDARSSAVLCRSRGPDAPAPPPDDLEALRARLAELEARVDDLSRR